MTQPVAAKLAGMLRGTAMNAMLFTATAQSGARRKRSSGMACSDCGSSISSVCLRV